MNEQIMKIPVKDLCKSLEDGYREYKSTALTSQDKLEIGHLRGYCRTIEQILNIYGSLTEEDIVNIKKPILGNTSMKFSEKQKKFSDESRHIDYDIPTCFRQN